MTRSKIIGTGMCVPKHCMTNKELETLVDTSEEWIESRTGIKTRYVCRDGETCVSLATAASKQAIQNAGIHVKDIELIIYATLSPNRVMPSAACELGDAIGAPHAPAFDLTAACSGFVFALSVADQFIRSGMYKTILCVGAEQLTAYVDWTDRSTCVLFGDGAGAAVVRATPDSDRNHILSTHMFCDSTQGDLLCIPASGSAMAPNHRQFARELAVIRMEGRELFKYAVAGMVKAGKEAMEANGLKADDVQLIIPHQANIRIIDAVSKRLEFPENKIMVNLHKYGNTSAATIPMALHECIAEGRVKKGDLIILVSFGGGLTYGSCALRL